MTEFDPKQRKMRKKTFSVYGYSELWNPTRGGLPQQRIKLGTVQGEDLSESEGKAIQRWGELGFDYIAPQGYFEEKAPRTLNRDVKGQIKPQRKVKR